MGRYGLRRHRKLFNFVKTYRQTDFSLLKFLNSYEFTLDRFILIWGITPHYIRTIFQSRYLINSGYIWVNFMCVRHHSYRVEMNDCVFFFKTLHSDFHVSMHELNPFNSKYRCGYSNRNFF